jgi:H+/gluconate symporter-like permease
MLGMIGLIVAFALLIVLAMRGVPILFIGLVCSAVIAVTSGFNIYDTLVGAYMSGYVAFLGSNFLIFLAGALFGRMMEITLGANSIADFIVRKLGRNKATLAIVISCFVLAYGGVSVFVVGFTIYPIALSLFREADLPRAYLPAAIGFGSVTFAMTSPGTPQIQNLIPAEALGTDPMAGAVVGIIAGIFMLVVGSIWLNLMVKKSIAGGAHFEERSTDLQTQELPEEVNVPNPLIALLPIIITILAMNLFGIPAAISIALSIAVGLIIMFKSYDPKNLFNDFSKGAGSAVTAITNTCAVVGFGSVVKSTPAFQMLIDTVTSLPILPLFGAAIAVTVLCGIAGSASGGLGIALPIVGPIYTAMGVPAAAIHRVASIASGALDSLPHNGYIVTLLNICGCSHKEGYMPLFKLTVLLPAAATILSVILFQIFPSLP